MSPGRRCPTQPTHAISSRDVPVTELPFDTRRINELLRLLPTDLSLEDTTDEHMALADELFWQLRRKDLGPVAVYTLRERTLRTVLRHEDEALVWREHQQNPQH